MRSTLRQMGVLLIIVTFLVPFGEFAFTSGETTNGGTESGAIQDWIDLSIRAVDGLLQNCKFKYLQISTVPRVVLSPDLLSQDDQMLSRQMNHWLAGDKPDDGWTCRIAEASYKGSAIKYEEQIITGAEPIHHSIFARDQEGVVWRYDERGDYKKLQLGADIDNAMFCAILPYAFLSEYMVYRGEKAVHIKFADIMSIPDPATFHENDKSVSFSSVPFRWDDNGRVFADTALKSRVSFEIDKVSGLPVRIQWYDGVGGLSVQFVVTDVQQLGNGINSPRRMYNETFKHDGTVFTRNLFFVTAADIQPIDDSVFKIGPNVPRGVPMVDRNLGLGDLRYE